MPKLKTSKTVSKRVKVTATRKVRVFPPGKSHLLSGKSPKRRRRLRRGHVLGGPMGKKLLRAVGGRRV